VEIIAGISSADFLVQEKIAPAKKGTQRAQDAKTDPAVLAKNMASILSQRLSKLGSSDDTKRSSADEPSEPKPFQGNSSSKRTIIIANRPMPQAKMEKAPYTIVANDDCTVLTWDHDFFFIFFLLLVVVFVVGVVSFIWRQGFTVPKTVRPDNNYCLDTKARTKIDHNYYCLDKHHFKQH